MVKVKICGITNYEDAHMASDLGADLLGFIFVPNTPRCVDPEKVRDIVFELRGRHDEIGFTGLFRDEDVSDVADVAAFAGLDLVQLHGREHPDYCAELKKKMKKDHDRDIRILKVFKVMDEIRNIDGYVPGEYHEADYFVFDTYNREIPGGTGERFDWDILARTGGDIPRPYFLAGGLDPANVAAAVRTARPYGVDVSSGTESGPGKKDKKLLKEFIKNAKEA